MKIPADQLQVVKHSEDLHLRLAPAAVCACLYVRTGSPSFKSPCSSTLKLVETSTGFLYSVNVALLVVLAINAFFLCFPPILFEICCLLLVYGLKSFCVFTVGLAFCHKIALTYPPPPIHTILKEENVCDFPLYYLLIILSGYVYKILTGKSHFLMWDHAFEAAAHQS